MFKSVTTCFSDAPIIGLTMGNKYPSFLCINIGLVYVCIRVKLLADIIARHAVTNLLLINFLTVWWPGSHITQPIGCSYVYTYMY